MSKEQKNSSNYTNINSLGNNQANPCIHFIKMNAAGNDFIIIDNRENNFTISKNLIIEASKRHNIGCDQFIIIENSEIADAEMKIFNPDGSLSKACGNATRCVASLIFENKDKTNIAVNIAINIAVGDRILECFKDKNLISVKMGKALFNWDEIELSKKTNSQNLMLFGHKFACVNIGNPHAVTFLLNDIEDEEFNKISPQIEHNPIFKNKTNIEFARILDDENIKVRVWERGAKETLSCGSGACAVAVQAIKQKLVKSSKVKIIYKGGEIIVQWHEKSNEIIMTGDYNKIFKGFFGEEFLSKL